MRGLKKLKAVYFAKIWTTLNWQRSFINRGYCVHAEMAFRVLALTFIMK